MRDDASRSGFESARDLVIRQLLSLYFLCLQLISADCHVSDYPSPPASGSRPFPPSNITFDQILS